MINSPCCPDSLVENLAFTLYAINEEENNSYFDDLEDIYLSMEQDLAYFETIAGERDLTYDEIEMYLYLCKETGTEPEDWVVGNYF